jgi:hypothetical protein
LSAKFRIRFRHIICLVLLGAATYYGVRAYKLLTLTPGKSVDYAQQVYDRVAAAQPGDNAWPHYEALHAAHTALKLEIRAEAPEHRKHPHPLYDSIYSGPPQPLPLTGHEGTDAANAEEAAAELEDHNLAKEWARIALERFANHAIDASLDKLVAARAMVRPKSDAVLLMATLIPDVGASREMARALKARIHLARDRGDHQAVVADFERVLALARHVGAQGTLIERLVGIAITALAMGEARDQMASPGLTPETCRALLAAIDRQVSFPPFSFHVECERSMLLDTLQYIHSDDGNGDGVRIITAARSLGDQAPGPRIMNLFGAFAPSKKQMVHVANTIFDGLAEAGDTPRRQDRKSVFDHELYVSQLAPAYKLLTLHGPSFEKAMASNDQSCLSVSGTRTMIAIELFRLEKGRLPASLADLVPAYLPVLPDDPYAPNGKLRFKILAEPDQHGRTYLLSSVGADETDDVGAAAKNPFDALRAVAGAGKDFIINTPPDSK